MNTRRNIGFVSSAFVLLVAGLWLGVAPEPTHPSDNEPATRTFERLRSAGIPKTNQDVLPNPLDIKTAAPTRVLQKQGDRRNVHMAPASQDKSDKGASGASSSMFVARFQDGRWMTQGDILVNKSGVFDGFGESETQIVSLSSVQYWPQGVVPYILEDGVDRERVIAALAEIHGRTNVRFVEHKSEADYIVFRNIDREQCQSHLGREGGEQEVLLGPNCTSGQILHELLHALGFVHEQSREDRDDYIKIVWDNIEPAYKDQFQKIPASISIPVPIPFDFNSVLLYPPTAFGDDHRITITKQDGSLYAANRLALSKLDVERVNRIYGR